MKSIIIAAVLILSSLCANACDCDKKPPMDSSVKNAAVIFKGKLIDVVYVRIIKDSLDIINPDSASYSQSPLRYATHMYKFLVRRTYKGKADLRISVFSAISEGECGYPFEKGKDYIVYAYYEKALDSTGRQIKILRTSACTRTGIYSEREAQNVRKMISRFITG